jgi:hypothetical protein
MVAEQLGVLAERRHAFVQVLPHVVALRHGGARPILRLR